MREPIISFKDYTYHYRAQAEPTIHHINLEIFKGVQTIKAMGQGAFSAP